MMPEMRHKDAILLIDNSNGRTKFLLSRQGCPDGKPKVFPTQQLTIEKVRELLSDWAFSSVCISSVVPEKAALLSQCFDCPVDFVSVQKKLPVDFSSYGGRKTLGADRVANILGVLDWNRFPVIAVDLGTAITFDLVTKDSAGSVVFAGGVISPGVSLFRDYLPSQTSLLPTVAGQVLPLTVGVGNNTEQAMQYGMTSGIKGMISAIIADMSSSLDEKPFVIATGGDARWAAELLPEINAVDSLLTFRGILRFALN